MRKKYWVVTWLLVLLSILRLSSQTLSKAESSYAQFNQLRSSGGTEATIYDALYRSYTEYVGVLKAAQSSTPDYTAAKRALWEMLPYLQMGAAWSSNHGQQANALLFAQAYMDIPLMEAFQGDTFMRDENYATMAYFAASGTFNSGNYGKAIPYFRAYLDSGERKNRENVYAFMAKACMMAKDYDRALQVLDEGTTAYPANYEMLKTAINTCIERKDYAHLQKFVEKAVGLHPNDEQLLAIQGKMYEELQEYQKALATFNKLEKLKPNNLDVFKHTGLNYYNLGVTYYNKAIMEQNEASAKRYNRQAKDYFSAAATTLESVVANDPTAKYYVEALAIAYSCMNEKEKLETVNTQLASWGIQMVTENTVPVLMTFEGSKGQGHNVYPDPLPLPGGNEIPLFSAFAKEYIESRIKIWQQKNEFETVPEYQARVTVETRNAKVKELQKQAEQEYLNAYTKNIKFNDMVLKQYDPDNESYLVESKFGDLIVPVPRDNNEAQVFKSSWSGMGFRNPQFYVDNNQLMLSSLTFVTPTGNSYRFDSSKDLAYTETVVNLDFDPIVVAGGSTNDKNDNPKRKKVVVEVKRSDVDSNIPETKVLNDRTFAVVFANEDYDIVSSVPYAKNDGSSFSTYCHKTLGLPEENVLYCENASFGKMLQTMRLIKDIADSYRGDMNVIFYYAGHGIPNEQTRDAFLLPVDADGKQLEGCYSLNRLYAELGALNARQVVVFLDACFSGSKRDGGMIASARAVALKVKPTEAQGNMVIFSAASDDETALPWQEKSHGLFTYFLLKKLQETTGKVTLKELGDYITDNVKQKSSVVNHKSQTPSVRASNSLGTSWEKKTLLH